MSSTRSPLQENLYRIIFEADTPAGKLFDVLLIISIKLSVLVVMLDSVSAMSQVYGNILINLEWFFTLLFTAEYLLRLYCQPLERLVCMKLQFLQISIVSTI